MEKIITLNILAFSILNATHNWYGNIPNNKQNFYIGYGSDADEQIAKQNAIVSISNQINIKIDNEIIRDKSIVDGNYKKNIFIKSSQKTKSNLIDDKLLKVSYEDGKYFVAIGYENIPNIDKFKNKLKAKGYKVNFYNYLKNFDLARIDKKWYIKYKDVIQFIKKRDFEKFFVTIPNKDLILTTNKKNNILYDKDEFYFKVKSAEDGYISILTVYEDGTVSTLMRNVPIKKNIVTNIPDKDFEAIPIAGVIEDGVDTFDMYVAIYSKKKMVLDRFVRADEELIEDERYKNFDELISFIKNKRYTTLKIVTKAR